MKKEKKSVKQSDNKKKEGLFCIVIAVLVLILLIFTINNFVFISALLISFALELFSVCYFFRDDKDKKIITYSLFTLGIGFIVIAIIYMIVNSI